MDIRLINVWWCLTSDPQCQQPHWRSLRRLFFTGTIQLYIYQSIYNIHWGNVVYKKQLNHVKKKYIMNKNTLFIQNVIHFLRRLYPHTTSDGFKMIIHHYSFFRFFFGSPLPFDGETEGLGSDSNPAPPQKGLSPARPSAYSSCSEAFMLIANRYSDVSMPKNIKTIPYFLVYVILVSWRQHFGDHMK